MTRKSSRRRESTASSNAAAEKADPVPDLGEALERFFALSLDLHVVSSPDGYFKHVSPSVTDLLGWSVAEFRSRSYLDFVHPDDQAATLREVEKQMRTGQSVLHFENRYRHKDDSWRVLAWKSMPAEGLMYATARDVTEFKRIEQEIVASRDATEAANRELEAFSYSVAHDLRAPLRGIDGFSHALLQDCGTALGDNGRRYLELVRQSVKQMATLIENILQLSRVTRRDMDMRTVDLSALAHEICARLRRNDPDRTVDIEIQDELAAVGDASLLAVMLENLLGNAWKFSSRRTDARIAVGKMEIEGETVYFVRDNGAGFDMKHVSKLFTAFERLHGTHEFEGTGIGLATVRRVVERHGGRIRADAEVGAGATFYFTLTEPPSC